MPSIDRNARAKPEVTIPTAPAHPWDEANVEWERISVELAKLGLLSQIERALAAYCECWSDWVKARKRCLGPDGKDLKIIKTGEKIRYDKDGNIVERSGGNFIENPH